MSENNKLTIEEALAVTAGAVKTWIEEHPEIGTKAVGEKFISLFGDIDNLNYIVDALRGDCKTASGQRVFFDAFGVTKVIVETSAQKVIHLGKNLFDVGSDKGDYYKSSNAFISVNPDTQQIVLKMSSASTAVAVRNTLIPVKTGDEITLTSYCDSHDINTTQAYYAVFDNDKNPLSYGANGTYVEALGGFVQGSMGQPVTIRITSDDVAYINLGFRLLSSKGIDNGEEVVTRIQCEFGNVGTEYEKGSRNDLDAVDDKAVSFAKYGYNIIFGADGSDITVAMEEIHITRTVNGKTGDVVLTPEDIGAMPIGYVEPSDIITRNRDVLPLVVSASRSGSNGLGTYNNEKQLTILATTDLHGTRKTWLSALKYMNEIAQIDFGVCLGDVMSAYFNSNDGTWFTNEILSSAKKMYPMIGNHDAGNTVSTITSATKQQQFDKFFSPVIGKLGLDGLTKTYYSVNTDYGVTLIMLDCHDLPDTMSGEDTFAVNRNVVGYSQDQVNWLIETLLSVPVGNHVMVAVHNTLDPATMVDGAWTQNGHMNSAHSNTGVYPDLIPSIIDAWQNGTTINATRSPANNVGAMPTLTVSADFTSRGKGIFAGYLRGHSHRDYIAKMTNYPTQNIFCLAATAQDEWNTSGSDLPRIAGDKTEDCITVVAVDKVSRKVKLVRIGSNITFDMVRRDMIAIDY